MEKWQRTHIKNNLTELISDTICNDMLLARLYQCGLLSEVEVQEIELTCLIPVKKSKRLYEILVTRKDAYNILLKQLETGKQTGVSSILKDGMLIELFRELELPPSQQLKIRDNINAKDKNGKTLVHIAARRGCLRVLELLKNLNANFELPNNNGKTAFLLLTLCQNRSIECFHWFIRQNINVNVKDKYGNNYIFLAAKGNGRKAEFQAAIQCGIEWNGSNTNGQIILHLAAVEGNLEALTYFKSLGADLEAKDISGETPLLYSTFARQNFIEMLNWFLNVGVNITVSDNYGSNLLLLAAVRGQKVSELQEIVNLGVDWQVKSKYGQSVLHYAARSGNVEALKYFKSLGAEVETKDSFGETPLLISTHSDQYFIEMLVWFLDAGANFKVIDENGNNLAFLAAERGRSKSELQKIVELGVDWQVKNKYGQSVLHYAARSGNVEALKYFKSLGAEVEAKDSFGETPLLISTHSDQHFIEMLVWFLDAGANFKVIDENGNNLAFLAANRGRSKSELQKIVELGVDWQVKNKDGHSVLRLAVQAGNWEVLEYFRGLNASQ